MENKIKFDFICEKGLTELELNSDGDIRPCCPAWTEIVVFGNVFNDNPDAVINSEKAKEFRRSILNKEYTYCKTDNCIGAHPISEEKLNSICEKDGTATKFCEMFNFGHDSHCNVRCIICRDHYCTNTEEQVQKLDAMIDSHLLPLLKDAQKVRVLCSGEVFASKHGRNLTKAIAQTYPNIKFVIASNGILFDEANCKELGIIDRLEEITISPHAATKETYDKIVLDGNYDRLWKNIKWLASLKKEGKIGYLGLVFAISKYNYKEMAMFLHKCNELDIEAVFFEYRQSESDMGNHYEEMAVWKPKNKEHKKFLKILSDPVFDLGNCKLSDQLQNMRNIEKEKPNFMANLLNFFKFNKSR